MRVVCWNCSLYLCQVFSILLLMDSWSFDDSGDQIRNDVELSIIHLLLQEDSELRRFGPCDQRFLFDWSIKWSVLVLEIFKHLSSGRSPD